MKIKIKLFKKIEDPWINWNDWFVWYPIRINSYFVWLEKIQRKKHIYDCYKYWWNYRFFENNQWSYSDLVNEDEKG